VLLSLDDSLSLQHANSIAQTSWRQKGECTCIDLAYLLRPLLLSALDSLLRPRDDSERDDDDSSDREEDSLRLLLLLLSIKINTVHISEATRGSQGRVIRSLTVMRMTSRSNENETRCLKNLMMLMMRMIQTSRALKTTLSLAVFATHGCRCPHVTPLRSVQTVQPEQALLLRRAAPVSPWSAHKHRSYYRRMRLKARPQNIEKPCSRRCSSRIRTSIMVVSFLESPNRPLQSRHQAQNKGHCQLGF